MRDDHPGKAAAEATGPTDDIVVDLPEHAEGPDASKRPEHVRSNLISSEVLVAEPKRFIDEVLRIPDNEVIDWYSWTLSPAS